MNISTIISQPEYAFLTTNSHLNNKLLFLTFGGSHAYGTNIEGSDIDIRGCALNSKSDILGLSNFEQTIDNATDTTIYGFNKLMSLLINCNPNTIEMLGGRPESYLFLNDMGKELVDNKSLFLSKRAINAFGGYANQQLRRLENALARDSYTQQEKEKHIEKSIFFALEELKNHYASFEEGSITLSTGPSAREDMDSEIFVDVKLDHYPLRDYKNIWSDMNNIVKEYGKLNHRNTKKDDIHLNKHAQHLIRLYLMCFDILEKGEINTYRAKDREMLLEIRKGKYQKSDGTYCQEFFELVNEYENRLIYAKDNTSLPDSPDIKKIEEFVMSVNERAIKES